MSALAQEKAALPDAQVEANVLRALASAPELSTQNIKTTTIYGVVTLSGSATDETSRTKAENLAARAEGVKKVVDEMSVGPSATALAEPQSSESQAQSQTDPSMNAEASGPAPNSGMVLQSDGTYAPAQAPQSPSQQANNGYGPPAQPQSAQPEPGYGAPPAPPANSGQYPQYPPQNGGQYPQQANAPYPPQPGAYPQQGNRQYPSNGQYPPSSQYPPRRPMYNSAAAYPVQGGQEAGRQVIIPSGAMVRIRINQGLSTKHAQPGAIFDGTVLNDVVADGAVAIPRGASVQGNVVNVEKAGALKGRGELTLQLTRLTLGGQTYALASDTWSRNGSDKTTHTVNSALGLGALGAVFGAVAGGGEGAAIGAGVGGAAGIASSAASPNGNVIVPPEAVLTFHLAQPTTVATVSEQEMARLSYAAGPNAGGPPAVRRGNYPQPYYAPYGPYYYPRY